MPATATATTTDVAAGPDAIHGAFVRMLEGAPPAPAIVRGDPDPVAVSIGRTLEWQRVKAERLTSRD